MLSCGDRMKDLANALMRPGWGIQRARFFTPHESRSIWLTYRGNADQTESIDISFCPWCSANLRSDAIDGQQAASSERPS